MPTANAHKLIARPRAPGHPATVKNTCAMSQVRPHLDLCITSIHPIKTLNKTHKLLLLRAPPTHLANFAGPRTPGPPHSEITNRTAVSHNGFVDPPPGLPFTNAARMNRRGSARFRRAPTAMPRAWAQARRSERSRSSNVWRGVFIPSALPASAGALLPTTATPQKRISCCPGRAGKDFPAVRSGQSNPHVIPHVRERDDPPGLWLAANPRARRSSHGTSAVRSPASASAKGQAPNQQTRLRVCLVR